MVYEPVGVHSGFLLKKVFMDIRYVNYGAVVFHNNIEFGEILFADGLRCRSFEGGRGWWAACSAN